MDRLLCFVLSIVFCLPLIAAQLPAGFAEQQIASGLDPTAMVATPDGRLLIAQKNGSVRIVENGQLLPGFFLQLEVDNYNERGLSGIALDPSFEANHYVYVYYTVPQGNYNRISRFTANGNFALPESEAILFELPPLSGTIHNGGSMHFGPDGKLYIAVGDGAFADNAQDLNTTLGKVLRINPDGSIPADNPFYDQLSGQQRAIWAYGFRNPFTTAMHPGSGRLFVNDVGGSNFEEVNEVLAGGNYGWPLVEGYLGGQSPPPNYQDPLYAYSHDEGCSVIGAAFYDPPDSQFPPRYHGKYFFGDYCSGFLRVLDPDSGEVLETFATGIQRPVALLTAPDGSLYYLERRGLGGGSEIDNTSTSNGVLWRIFYTGSGAPFISSQPQPVLVPQGEAATFSITASGAPPVAYQWQRDGQDIPGATEASYSLNPMLADDGSLFRCIASNAEGADTSLAALLQVTANTRPEPVLLLPAVDALYRAGDTLFFSGAAADAEDGQLSAGRLSWRIDFHHAEHTHPAMAPVSGISEGFYLIPRIGEADPNVWYRVYLTATDTEGLSQSVFRDVYPEKAQITVYTEPPGLPLRIDGQSKTTPYSFSSVVGIIRSIQAPATQIRGDTLFSFREWPAFGQEGLLTLQTPAEGLEITAHYDALPLGKGSGLTGAYYDEEEHVFSGNPAFWRIDSIIDFNWASGSAAPMLIGEDFFSIRWTGGVEPLYSEVYTFHVISDDGIRLWVDSTLLIDQWVPQPATETTGSIFLETEQVYPIRLEYFEDGGAAVCQLFWSSSRTPRALIPKTQLYPELPEVSTTGQEARFSLQLFPQPAATELTALLEWEEAATVQARIFSLDGHLHWKGLFSHTPPVSHHRLDVSRLPAGMYVLELANDNRRLARQLLIR